MPRSVVPTIARARAHTHRTTDTARARLHAHAEASHSGGEEGAHEHEHEAAQAHLQRLAKFLHAQRMQQAMAMRQAGPGHSARRMFSAGAPARPYERASRQRRRGRARRGMEATRAVRREGSAIARTKVVPVPAHTGNARESAQVPGTRAMTSAIKNRPKPTKPVPNAET